MLNPVKTVRTVASLAYSYAGGAPLKGPSVPLDLVAGVPVSSAQSSRHASSSDAQALKSGQDDLSRRAAVQADNLGASVDAEGKNASVAAKDQNASVDGAAAASSVEGAERAAQVEAVMRSPGLIHRVSRAPVMLGAAFSYTIEVHNGTPFDLAAFEVTDRLDPSVTLNPKGIRVSPRMEPEVELKEGLLRLRFGGGLRRDGTCRISIPARIH